MGHRPRQQRGADRGAQVFQIHARLRGALPGRGARGAVLGRRRIPATVDPVSGGRRDGGDATAQAAAAADPGVPSRRMSRAADAGASFAGSELTHPLLANHTDGGGRLDMIRDQRERARRTRRTTSSIPVLSVRWRRRRRSFSDARDVSWEATSPPARTARPHRPHAHRAQDVLRQRAHVPLVAPHGCAHRHYRRRTRVDSSRKSAATRAAGGSVGDGPRGHAGAGLLGASQREGDGGRVLTIVHKHEYRVTFPEGAGANGNFAFSPKVEEGGVGARLPGRWRRRCLAQSWTTSERSGVRSRTTRRQMGGTRAPGGGGSRLGTIVARDGG